MLKFLRNTTATALLVAMLPLSTTLAFEKPVLLADQGSFLAGGNVKQETGNFDFQNPANP